MYFCLLVIFFPSPNEGRIRESLSAWSEVHETNETETKWKSRNRRRTTLARMGKAGSTRPQGSSIGSQVSCACLSARGNPRLGILPIPPPWRYIHSDCMSPVFISSVISFPLSPLYYRTQLYTSTPGCLLRNARLNFCNQRKRERGKSCARWPQKKQPELYTHKKKLFHFEWREEEREKKNLCIFPDFQSSSLCLCQCCIV